MPRMRDLKRAAAASVSRAGVWPALSGLAGNSLRVLLYHRICDPASPSFFGFKAIVSATPADFERQMDYVSKHYSTVSLEDCLAWIYDGVKLPPRAILITFDDGYRDNLTNALPVLEVRKIPWVLFATINCIEDRIFFWDWAAEAFRSSQITAGDLPLLGHRSWKRKEADSIANQWVEAVKKLDEERRFEAVVRLSELLHYELYDKAPAGTYLSWADLAEMRCRGCTIGAHTVSHAMMLGLPAEKAEQEIAASKAILEETLGAAVLSFAFPFGHTTEYDAAYTSILARCGFRAAFRSTGGINLRTGARRNPFELRRRAICQDDGLDHFAAWASGASRLKEH